MALANDTGPSGTDHVTRDASLTVTPAETGGSFFYTVDGNAVAAYDPATLRPGDHTVTVAQQDAAGNTGAAASLAFTLEATVTVDSTAPILTISGVSGATNLVDHVVSGTIDLADAGATVTVADGASLLGTAVSDAQGRWSLPFVFLGDGTGHSYQIAASATDAAGNIGSAGFTLALDFTPNMGLFGSVTHDPQSHGGEVYALFDGLLGRTPDPSGWESSVPALDHGASLHDVAQGILASSEWMSRFGDETQLSDGAFVDTLYSVALGRAPDAVGEQGWLAALHSGTSRADVALGFATSQENENQLAGAFGAGIFVPDAAASDVARLYEGLLHRSPDQAGMQGWLDQIKAGTTLTSIAQGFLSSLEYGALHPGAPNDQQYVEDLYEHTLGRPASDPGAGNWLSGLANHTLTRADVAIGIADSAEAHIHLAGHVESGWHLA